jgi:3-oxoacyl-[acyl-carrier-protein] synthase-3
MSFFKINNIRLLGISSCVPKDVKYNTDTKFISNTGVSETRVTNENICASDLCLKAADQLILDLKIDKQDIEILIFVSQTPDYKIPITSAILQDRLGLSKSCMCFDISLGCSGYVYGLSVISSIISATKLKKGLLLVGDTISKEVSKKDQSTYPLFGDAGSATILEYDTESNPIFFGVGTDGKDYGSIIIKDGGSRNKFNKDSLTSKMYESGIERTNCDLYLDGINVFTFGTGKVPIEIDNFLQHFLIDKNNIDYYLFHQANKFMNDKICKKLQIPIKKVPSSLHLFGNTSCASIPLTITTELESEIKDKNILLSGFGVGLSWATCYISLNKSLYCIPLIEHE